MCHWAQMPYEDHSMELMTHMVGDRWSMFHFLPMAISAFGAANWAEAFTVDIPAHVGGHGQSDVVMSSDDED